MEAHLNSTHIEWTDLTWNPIRARNKITGKTGTFCTRISPGCTHCYASKLNVFHGNGLEYTVPNLDQVEFFISEKILEEPLRRKKPSKIFVGDMFDLFHEAIPQILVAQVLWTAVRAKWHTFQFLTKRAERMMNELKSAEYGFAQRIPEHMHFGVSVEDQQRANERIPFLLQTPAAVRFLSVEPMLEAVSFRWASWLPPMQAGERRNHLDGMKGIDWIICGGESGPGARPFNLAWAESLLVQCRAVGVPFFMKQVGSAPFKTLKSHAMGIEREDQPMPDEIAMHLKDRKGGDPAEWPEHLRVREFPAERSVSA